MNDLAIFHRSWNAQQKELRQLLNLPEQHDAAVQLFLSQHAQLHTAQMANLGQETYADAILGDMAEAQMRHIPRNFEHSIVWLIWHMARIEDVTMNLLLAGQPQLLRQSDWSTQMAVTYQDTGNAMNTAEIADLSTTIELEALLAYRLAVGRRTREIVQSIPVESLRQKVNLARLQQIMEEGAVAEASLGLLDYWGKRTFAGFLLMPPTRHNMVHLNEALKIKQRRR
jgi:hypothetical protein